MIHRLRMPLSMILVLAMLLPMLLATPTEAKPMGTITTPAYTYQFFGIDGAAVRYKAPWGKTPEVSCASGSALPDGQLIITTAVDIRNNRFVMWVYPSDSLWYFAYNNIRTESSPPEGWNSNKDRWDPTKACLILHEVGPGTYRIKVMFTSYTRNDDWLLALMDTGTIVVVTPVSP